MLKMERMEFLPEKQSSWQEILQHFYSYIIIIFNQYLVQYIDSDVYKPQWSTQPKSTNSVLILRDSAELLIMLVSVDFRNARSRGTVFRSTAACWFIATMKRMAKEQLKTDFESENNNQWATPLSHFRTL